MPSLLSAVPLQHSTYLPVFYLDEARTFYVKRGANQAAMYVCEVVQTLRCAYSVCELCLLRTINCRNNASRARTTGFTFAFTTSTHTQRTKKKKNCACARSEEQKNASHSSGASRETRKCKLGQDM